MSMLTAQMVSRVTLPVIDIAGLRAKNLHEHKAAATEVRNACLDKGFFYITNHGIPEVLRQRVLAEAKRFFDQSLETKLSIDRANSRANRGYEPLRRQTLEPGGPPDLKEGFYIGVELSEDDPRVISGKFDHGPNQWPSNLPGFRETMDAYFAAMLELEQLLWRGLALSLHLEETAFSEFCRNPIATLRLLHYPQQPANPRPGEKGCGAHTDFGGTTLLLQDNAGGLQVWDQEQQSWIHAPPLGGTYVVNLGDMVARWTNDRYRSTLHRVVNLSGNERYSVPFFFTGNPDQVVSCLPTCLAPGETAKYPPTLVSEHLAKMFRRTYGS